LPSTMAKLTFAERLEAEEALLDWMKKHRGDIDRFGGNSKLMIDALGPAIEATRSANTTQEKMKAALKDQTRSLNASDRHSYVLGSSYFDVVTGLYGKNSAEAQQLRRIRSKMRKPAIEKPTA
jgi:hypothetical protein